ncbi:MAG TPA: phosphatase PAP2 family protein [Candidatus Angelobacter sp.]|nr:phosphatase PAP2 family protein [Candidatus Angelobacter sp.]
MRWIAHVGAALGRSLRIHSPFMALVVLYVAAAFVLPPLFGVQAQFSPGLYSDVLLTVNAAFFAGLLLAYTSYVLIKVRPPRLTHYLWTEITGRYVTVERVCMALPVFVLFPLFASTFTYFKAAIPLFHPFAWDVRLAAWDAALHGGHAAWEWLQPVFGYPYATALVTVFYHLWFFVTYGVLAWQAISLSRPRLRMQYLLTTLLLWSLVGTLAATSLSSAGPVYFARVTGLPDPFAPLMAYLRQANEMVPVLSLQVQDMLWQAYAGNGTEIGAGISAMPSLHVATSFSYMLVGFAVRRWLGILLAGFAALILIGSVHLGWHYAIDGYAGILCTVAIWFTVGWLLDRPAVARLLRVAP